MNTLFILFFILLQFSSSIFCYYYDNSACKTIEDYFHIDGNPNCFHNIDFQLNLPQLVLKYTGNKVKAYKIQTEDGYLLTMYRIPRKNPKGIILLQHPIISSSIAYVLVGANDSLAITLWHAGYDVWMNNARGTNPSEKHVKYTVDDYQYWNWSFHEVAVYEVPLQIELIRRKTNYTQKIIFYGHSLGTTIGLIYSSLFPEQSEESVKVFMFAGVTGYYKYNDGMIIGVAQLTEILRTMTSYFRWGGVILVRNILLPAVQILARTFPVLIKISYEGAILFNGNGNYTDPQFANMDVILILENFSWKMVYHLFQLMNAKTRFQLYDYGPERNKEVYGNELPPLYPLENITVPTLLIYSEDDLLTTPRDSLMMYEALPEKAKKYGILKLKGLNHIDYFFSHYRKEHFYDYFLEFLDKIQ